MTAAGTDGRSATSPLDWLFGQLRARHEALSVATGSKTTSYSDLYARIQAWIEKLAMLGILDGQVVSVEGDYDTERIAALLAAVALRNIVVPLSPDVGGQQVRFRELAHVQWRILSDGNVQLTAAGQTQISIALFDQLRDAKHPGLVLFTSGSTGDSKAAVHDFSLLLDKFRLPKQQLRTLVFLQLDHIGGLNTLLYALSNGGAVVVPKDRSPAGVCQAMQQHAVELLPTSPTFLNLLLLSEEHKRHDLRSLRLITYGTEPMPASTLERLNLAFPNVKLQQTYGLTELGILQSKSRDSQSLWVRVGGEGYETKVVEGKLAIRARTAMLGYLNFPSPFDSDGFLHTGDRVEVDGEWLRILGRDSEIINVGGNKVHPAEVESVLLEMEGVLDAAVSGEPHSLTGQVVTATVRLAGEEQPREFRARMRLHFQKRLPLYAVPVKVRVSCEPLHNARFKRIRRAT